ncbi:putative outer membrane protein with a TonB box [Erythrobacter sp. NAP1]|uniref:TonB-dependent receptor n=1 Tax=Erythrobacter sp. NAP1 TaxID=237727 RepID=UPI0000687806|nr:TonB-dependent receptor [Erythrobacter sp. NAP1]EAQ28957.1 putative outer membrane protein with a TonB box [Erythrobacter sp. NAP1]
MKLKYLLAASVVSLSAAATIATPAAAQQITSGVEGSVSDANGGPLAGAMVTITDERTSQTRTSTTGANGTFRVQSLPPGGPYTVTVTADGFEGQSVENVFVNISGNTSFGFTLDQSATGNTIVVTGARAQVTQVAVGPGTAFDTQTLEAFPSITRDVRDIIRIDPRVSLDRANEVDRVSCLGGNDRSNTFTVDGIVQADVFGLNGTPFAARNALPLPFDVIEQTSVEFAPFDVEYSEFTGCLVNVVTKAGSNRFHGSAFITYFDDGLFANSIDGRPLNAGSEKRWGATLNGPIIPDRLFFSFGYEETDLGDGNNFGPAGGGFTNEADFVSQAQFDRFAQIARDVYGQDIGGYPTSLAEASVRYFGRIDAVLSDQHRLEATYQRLEETNIESDFGGQNITGFNSFEDEGTESDYYSVRLYSDWNDTISTELRVSRAEVGDIQGPVGFGEAQSDNPTVRLAVGVAPDGTSTENGLLSTGPGIFRSANQLDTRIDQARFQMNVDAGDGHFLKFGVEVNDLEVFNLFAINATGTLFFDGLDNFEAGNVAGGGFSSVFGDVDDLVGGGPLGGGTIATSLNGDINNAAARFGRTIWSFYAQDEWQATDQLSITAGVRAQLYDGDAPRANPNFLNRYGFTNAQSFGGLSPVILPRISATYELFNDGFFSDSSITGGVGVFSGGDPVVYYSNAFSNDGFASANGDTFDAGCAGLTNADGSFNVLNNGTFTGFPQCAIDEGAAAAGAGLADVQSTDPDFDVPTVIRANIGFQTTFGPETGFFSNWNMNLDYIYSRFQDTLNFVDLSQAPDIRTNGGFTVDGRPIYQAVDATAAGCNATLVSGGTPPVYTGLTPECFNTRRDDNIQLTNGPGYESHVASFILNKTFSEGLFTEGGAVTLNFGYAFTDSENFRNVGSSTATSSFDVSAAFDRQAPAISTSNFETRHNFTASAFFREEFFDGYDTGLAILFRAQAGTPFSLTFDGGGVFADSSSGNDNALLYIPSGVGDANVSPLSDPAAITSLLDYLATSDVGEACDFELGESIERNTCRNDWHYDLDLRFSQELPFIGSLTGIVEDRVELFVDFENFLNLLDSSANIRRQRTQFLDLVDGGVDDQGRYIISGFRPDDDNNIGISASAWRIQIGARYEF